MAATLITDLDNTLYNWTDFFAPSFRGMVHAIAPRLRVTEDYLYDEFRELYAKHGTLEYAFTIQELPSTQDLSQEEVEALVHVGRVAFSQVRKKNLRPYSDVAETLEWMVQGGLKVVGVTNAPIFHAAARLRHLGLQRYFSGLAGWKGHEVPADGLRQTTELRESRERTRARATTRDDFCYIELSQAELKPSPSAYARILAAMEIVPSEAFVVGDSVEKDLRPAGDLGMRTVWARYGKDHIEKNFQTLLRITHWSPDRIKSTYEEASFSPDYVIDGFGELRAIVPLTQLQLF